MGEMRSDNTTYKYNPNDRGTIEAEFVKTFGRCDEWSATFQIRD